MGRGFGIDDDINVDGEVDLNAMAICSLAYTKVSIYS